MAVRPLAPLDASSRLRGIDVARGIALLGILLVNARFFFAPFGFAVDPSVALDGSERQPADAAAWALVEAFCSYKFISLFSMLFGFGLAMQAARAREQGGSPWPMGLRRLGLLAAVGIIHWTLVWSGDILMIYALLGVVVLAATGLARRTVGLVCVGLSVLVGFIAVAGAAVSWLGLTMMAGQEVPPEIPADALVKRGFDAMLAAKFSPYSPAWIEAEVVAFRDGPFLDALLFRAVAYGFAFLFSLFTYGWQSLFMMLCGVYAFKAGLFGPEGSSVRRRLALPLLGIGLAFSALAVLPSFVLGFDSVAARAMQGLFLSLGAMALPFAYAAIILERAPQLPRVLATPLERAGRMSFTVYLGESLVCTALASWWGFAWFGSIDDVEAALIALAVWVALVAFATLWLGCFRIGPFEWLWRRVTYSTGPRTL